MGNQIEFEDRLKHLLHRNDTKGAISELKSYLTNLSKEEIVGITNSGYWGNHTRDISRQIFLNHGKIECRKFWEDMLGFFKGELKDKFGHLHKGDILWNLAALVRREEVSLSKGLLEEAMADNEILEGVTGKKSNETSSYTMLCIIESIEDEDFEDTAEKEKFFSEMLPFAFNLPINLRNANISPKQVEDAIRQIVPQEGLDQIFRIKYELDKVYELELQISTISLCGTFLESIIYSILYFREGIRLIQTRSGRVDISKATLGTLFQEALRMNVFPKNSIKVSCETVKIFRDRFHPGNEIRQNYPLTRRVAKTIKILLDVTLLEWRKEAI